MYPLLPISTFQLWGNSVSMTKLSLLLQAAGKHSLNVECSDIFVVKAIGQCAQFFMTVYAARASLISAPVIIALCIVTFVFGMLEALLDLYSAIKSGSLEARLGPQLESR
jgi:hypothetical protein